MSQQAAKNFQNKPQMKKSFMGSMSDKARVANIHLDNFLATHGIKSGAFAYPDLDVAVLKATNNIEVTPKEKHVLMKQEGVSDETGKTLRKNTLQTRIRTLTITLLQAVASGQSDYVIIKLAIKLQESGGHWLETQKTLMVFHRLMRNQETQHFPSEVKKYEDRFKAKNFLELKTFQDFKNRETQGFSQYIRQYSYFLQERVNFVRESQVNLEQIDVKDFIKLSMKNILEITPSLIKLMQAQQGCMVTGYSRSNDVILASFKLVLIDSNKIYILLQQAILKIIDGYFDLDKEVAVDVFRTIQDYVDVHSKLQIVGINSEITWGDNLASLPSDFLLQLQEYIKDIKPQNPFKEVLDKNKQRQEDKNVGGAQIITQKDLDQGPDKDIKITFNGSPQNSKEGSNQQQPEYYDLISFDESIKREHPGNQVKNFAQFPQQKQAEQIQALPSPQNFQNYNQQQAQVKQLQASPNSQNNLQIQEIQPVMKQNQGYNSYTSAQITDQRQAQHQGNQAWNQHNQAFTNQQYQPNYNQGYNLKPSFQQNQNQDQQLIQAFNSQLQPQVRQQSMYQNLPQNQPQQQYGQNNQLQYQSQQSGLQAQNQVMKQYMQGQQNQIAQQQNNPQFSQWSQPQSQNQHQNQSQYAQPQQFQPQQQGNQIQSNQQFAQWPQQ